MRVIAGQSRGRRLSARLPAGVRPTSDRVKESIFDILGSMGGVDDLDVVDLFCGSGAMGVEALSRGAASATFVDDDNDALNAVAANLAAVGLSEASRTLVRATLPGWLAGSRRFDLALCDPPYDFSAWGELLGALRADVAVLESGTEIEIPEPWMVTKARRYGGTLVTVVRQTPAQTTPAVAGS
jgi:16S rRNA (guanine966-N2)-methyltransferase